MSFALPTRPYPPDRYTRAEPEANAWLRRSDAPHDIELSGGGACDYLATGVQTSDEYGLYRWNMGPGVAGPSEHFHRAISESFFVLSGVIRIHTGTEWIDAGPGDFAYVPPGGIHGFRNESGQPASMLILFAPGAARERYFEGLSELAALGEKPTDAEMAEFYEKHDTFWL